MPKCLCTCGAKYRVGDDSIGRRAKCKKCGEVFVLQPEDGGVIPLADEHSFADEAVAASQRATGAAPSASGTPAAAFDPSTLPPVVIEHAPFQAVEKRKIGGYFTDLVATLVFIQRPSNIAPFVVLWIIVCIKDLLLPRLFLFRTFGLFAGFGLFAMLIVIGWYSAFRFGVIAEAAAGEPNLPEVAMSDGLMEDVVLPFFKWIAASVVVFTPALVAFIVLSQTASLSLFDLFDLLDVGVGIIFEGSFATELAVFLVLWLFGLFMWPMVILCVTLGGFSTVARADLMIGSVLKTFPAYLLTVALVFGAEFLYPFLVSQGGGYVAQASAIAVYLYWEIVALRAIGLYYVHFKHKFAWNWG